jgi:hypothetical protein
MRSPSAPHIAPDLSLPCESREPCCRELFHIYLAPRAGLRKEALNERSRYAPDRLRLPAPDDHRLEMSLVDEPHDGHPADFQQFRSLGDAEQRRSVRSRRFTCSVSTAGEN